MPSGAIYLAMGPSGAGKDTLLLGARAALSNDPRVHFISRRLTRSADRTTDIEISVTPEEFARAEAASEHAFSWDAHRTRYAIAHAALDTALAANGRCLLNVSRTIIDDVRAYAAARGVEVYCLYITCSDAALRERLLARGRESASAIDERLARSRAIRPYGAHVLTIPNEGSVEEGVNLVVRTLLGDAEAIAAGRSRTLADATVSHAADAAAESAERRRRRTSFMLLSAAICVAALAHSRRVP